jgi:hypothetical protein
VPLQAREIPTADGAGQRGGETQRLDVLRHASEQRPEHPRRERAIRTGANQKLGTDGCERSSPIGDQTCSRMIERRVETLDRSGPHPEDARQPARAGHGNRIALHVNRCAVESGPASLGGEREERVPLCDACARAAERRERLGAYRAGDVKDHHPGRDGAAQALGERPEVALACGEQEDVGFDPARRAGSSGPQDDADTA